MDWNNIHKLGSYIIVAIGIWSCNSQGDNHLMPKTAYVVDSIEMADGLSGEVGAMAFLPSGKLIAAFRRGEVMTYDIEKREWSVFAQGLHLPLGIEVLSENEILVMQYAELTRIKDVDGDGQADQYLVETDDFGISGNYHEFTYGPVKDESGNHFIGLNSTSSGGVMMDELRGEKKEIGFREKGMYAAVPYRGWLMKWTVDGQLQPFASGFRSPNGLGFDLDGHLLVTDNQGDWVGTSPLFHVEEGKFYGHPTSLVWEEGWSRGRPSDLPIEDLDSMRQRPAVLFPHNIMANSPTQPLCDDTGGKFGPFAGQILVGEMNQERIVRVMLEEVGGALQGACVPFIDKQGLRKGNNRLAFDAEGRLWVGQNASGWAGSSGIQCIRFTGKMPFDILTMKIIEGGFELTFTKEISEDILTDLDHYLVSSYYYNYHEKYGSDQMDKKDIDIQSVEVLDKGKKLRLLLDPMEKDRIYELQLLDVVSQDQDTLENNLICYTVNHLK